MQTEQRGSYLSGVVSLHSPADEVRVPGLSYKVSAQLLRRDTSSSANNAGRLSFHLFSFVRVQWEI